MDKEFLSYEPSLALKELGFNEPCFGYHYTLNGENWEFAEKSKYYSLDDEINIGGNFTLAAPTFSQAFRWLYQKLDIEKGVMPLDTESQKLLLKELIERVKEVSNEQ